MGLEGFRGSVFLRLVRAGVLQKPTGYACSFSSCTSWLRGQGDV